MNTGSRINNSLKNISVGISMQIINMLLTFLVRIIFVYVFGEVYLGINGLFTNVIAVLSVTEMGVGGAIVYCLYKPIADNDEEKVAILINYYKYLYRIIGTIVAIIGLALLPFLHNLINLTEPIEHIEYYYLLYLANALSTYFIAYKTTIFVADQKDYLLKLYRMFFLICSLVIQIVVAIIFKNFTLYLTTQIIMSIANNIFCSYKAAKKYPFIDTKTRRITCGEKKEIFDNVKSMMSYQIGNVVLNNTDNILISVLIGTITVGYYSNYNLITTAVNSFAILIFSSIQASIGNLIASGEEEKIYPVFKSISYLGYWIFGFCAISIFVLSNDFICLFFGQNYEFSTRILSVIVFNFYVFGSLYPIYCYRNTIGLFKQTKYIMLFTSVANLILSIIMGKSWGLFGILIATGISRIITNWWYEPFVLFKKFFHKNVTTYYFHQVTMFLFVFMIAVSISLFFSNVLVISSLMLRLIIKTFACLIIINLMFYLAFYKSGEPQKMLKLILNLFYKRKCK